MSNGGQSSHLLHEVQATADHLVVISEGAVVASGRMDDLLASSSLIVRSPDPVALAAALRAGHIDYAAGPDGTFTVDLSGGRITPELVAGAAGDHQVLLSDCGDPTPTAWSNCSSLSPPLPRLHRALPHRPLSVLGVGGLTSW